MSPVLLKNGEELISLRDACKLFVTNPCLATVHRWRQRGCRGVVLESVRIGCQIYTTRESVDRFLEALQHTDEDRLVADGC